MGCRKGWVGTVGLAGMAALLTGALPQLASAEEGKGEAGSWPRVGGHWGVALPLVSFTDEGTTGIFADFLTVGIAPGVTVKLNEKWSIDFEFIAFSRWQFENDGTPARASTSIVVDPGVVYDFGPFSGGLRTAVQVGPGVPFNLGLVPIINKGFAIHDGLKWFVELDLPFFVTGVPGDGGVSFTPLIQTGVAF
ncbi:hypothetical protein JYJ95_38220 [Corallococcus exiguus]|uniref:hypothetical protein n=1 Tax=Corallococcus exiguus TaxID=83462 RepID=UPI001A908BFC|nr:hypothetical protein [Corallococcus exiguus]MBN8472375.1 hypothetical protein [Corallococcus exiguus]